MANLTKAQMNALGKIAETPRKSGSFWRDLGISPGTISRLEDQGLIGAAYRVATSETTILRRSWDITPAGRQALSDAEKVE